MTTVRFATQHCDAVVQFVQYGQEGLRRVKRQVAGPGARPERDPFPLHQRKARARRSSPEIKDHDAVQAQVANVDQAIGLVA
jgi:hypothetical protein